MILNYIELQGFGSYEEFTHWDVPMGITGIIGIYDENEKKSNGSGKSTMVSAIIYALYGEGEFVKLEELINDRVKINKGQMFVRLNFIINKQAYCVERGIKTGSYLDFYTIDAAGEKHRVGDESTKIGTTQQSIINVLKMEYAMFSASGFFEQNKLDKFVNIEPSIRRSYTDKVFDLETWRIALKTSTSDTSELKIKVSNLLKEILTQETREKELAKELKIFFTKEDELKKEVSLKEEKEKGFVQYEKLFSLKTSLILRQESYETNKNNFKKYDEEINIKKEEVEKLKNKIGSINDINSLKELISTFSVKETDLENKKKELVNDASNVNNEKLKISSVIAGLQSEIKVENSRRLSDNVSLCPLCNQEITQDHINFENEKIDKVVTELQKKIEESKKQLKIVEDKLREVSSKDEDYEKELTLIKNNKEEASRKIHQKEIEILSYTKDLKNCEVSIVETVKLKKDIDKENESILKEIENYKNQINKESLIGIPENIEDLKNEINKINDKIISLNSELTELRIKQQEYDNLKNLIESNKNSLKVLQEDLYFYELSTSIFKDIPTEIFKNSIKEVETAANDIIQRVIPTLQVKIWEDLDKKSRKLMISFISNGFERSYERLSGGEKTIANIGIRLGYSQVITARANTSIDFIVLDEPFGALDEENKDLIKKIFAVMSQWFTQIIVISHDDSIENFPNLLRIGKTEEGMSYILN